MGIQPKINDTKSTAEQNHQLKHKEHEILPTTKWDSYKETTKNTKFLPSTIHSPNPSELNSKRDLQTQINEEWAKAHSEWFKQNKYI